MSGRPDGAPDDHRGRAPDDGRGGESAERLAGLVVRLYRPAARRDRAAEITDTVRDALRGQGPAGAARELADLFAHALRHRLGLTASSRFGAAVAAAAPLAAASGAVLSAVFLLFAEWDWRAQALPNPSAPPSFGPFTTLGPVVYACWLLVLVAATLGHRRATRAFTGASVLAAAATFPLSAVTGVPRPPLFVLAPLVFFAAVVLAAPVDPLAPERADRRPVPLLAAAGLAALTAATFANGDFWETTRIPGIPATRESRPLWYRHGPSAAEIGFCIAALLVVGLVAALLLMRRNPPLPAAVLLIAPPWLMLVRDYNVQEVLGGREALIWTAAATLGTALAALTATATTRLHRPPAAPTPD
ncbi:hypothetical protein [Actinomadura atramentaria]|uniref:hypothetical protein n=1 Tax=Actinomadura atramentaria TaxID=1990 RepID=UPI000375911E|nr:hypothetical protein [Actinomadura atramentaria]